jgi:hypothetical protein
VTDEQITLLRQAAQTLLDHAAVGRKCAPESIEWAKDVLRNNPAPKPKANGANHVE